MPRKKTRKSKSVLKEIHPLFDRGQERLNLFPIQHPDLWELYTNHLAMIWTPDEIDLSADSYDSLDQFEQKVMDVTLAFFSNFDKYVIDNVKTTGGKVTILEALMFLRFQEPAEDIHYHTYQLMIKALIKDEEKQKFLYKGSKNIAQIKKLAKWCINHMNSKSDIKRQYVQAMIEYCGFPPFFIIAFWFRKNNKLPGFGHANELIMKDEGLHSKFFFLLFEKYYDNKYLSKESAKALVIEFTDLIKLIFKEAIPIDKVGLTLENMYEYCEFLAKNFYYRTYGEIIYPNAKTSFLWANMIGMEGNTNFFEKRVGDYARSTKTEENKFDLDTDY